MFQLLLLMVNFVPDSHRVATRAVMRAATRATTAAAPAARALAMLNEIPSEILVEL